MCDGGSLFQRDGKMCLKKQLFKVVGGWGGADLTALLSIKMHI